MSLGLVFVGDKAYIGRIASDAVTDDGIMVSEALEVWEMMIPTEQGQFHRLVNFKTISPFDKSTQDILIRNPIAIVKLDDNSDSARSYEGFKSQFSRIQVVPGGAMPQQGQAPFDFSGKFTPGK